MFQFLLKRKSKIKNNKKTRRRLCNKEEKNEKFQMKRFCIQGEFFFSSKDFQLVFF